MDLVRGSAITVERKSRNSTPWNPWADDALRRPWGGSSRGAAGHGRPSSSSSPTTPMATSCAAMGGASRLSVEERLHPGDRQGKPGRRCWPPVPVPRPGRAGDWLGGPRLLATQQPRLGAAGRPGGSSDGHIARLSPRPPRLIVREPHPDRRTSAVASDRAHGLLV